MRFEQKVINTFLFLFLLLNIFRGTDGLHGLPILVQHHCIGDAVPAVLSITLLDLNLSRGFELAFADILIKTKILPDRFVKNIALHNALIRHIRIYQAPASFLIPFGFLHQSLCLDIIFPNAYIQMLNGGFKTLFRKLQLFFLLLKLRNICKNTMINHTAFIGSIEFSR